MYHVSLEKLIKMVEVKYWGDKFGSDVKILRKGHNLDLRVCSSKIGISAPTLSRIENGGIPDLKTFAAICKWSGFKMQDYITYTKKKNK